MMQFQHEDHAEYGLFFLNNAAGQRIAEIRYQWAEPHRIIADHTWVDDSLRGQGVARKLLDVLVEFARERQLKITATCSYVVTMFQRDQSLADVIA